MQYTLREIKRQSEGTILQNQQGSKENHYKRSTKLCRRHDKAAEKAAPDERMGDVFKITKKLCGKKSNINIPIRNKQGTLLTETR